MMSLLCEFVSLSSVIWFIQMPDAKSIAISLEKNIVAISGKNKLKIDERSVSRDAQVMAKWACSTQGARVLQNIDAPQYSNKPGEKISEILMAYWLDHRAIQGKNEKDIDEKQLNDAIADMVDVEITSVPSEARVRINKLIRGKAETTLTVFLSTKIKYSIDVEKEGFAAFESTFQPTKQEKKFMAKLEKK